MALIASVWWRLVARVWAGLQWPLVRCAVVLDPCGSTGDLMWSNEWMESFFAGDNGWNAPLEPDGDGDDDGEPFEVIPFVTAPYGLAGRRGRERRIAPIHAPPALIQPQ